MNRHVFDSWVICGIVVAVAGWVAWKALPSIAPTFAWRTKCPSLQEPAIRHLMKRLYVGMTYEEMVEVMGKPDGGLGRTVQKDGTEFYSYNVNSWYNRGIDITLKNGRVVRIFEYD